MGCLIRWLLAMVLVAALAYLVVLIMGNESGSSAEFELSTEFDMSSRGEMVVAPTETTDEASTPTVAPTLTPPLTPTHPPVATSLETWAPTPEWYAGGTLHQASFDEWFRATDANRLATAAYWIIAADGQTALNTDSLHVEANQLVICIREAAPTSPAASPASKIAAMCRASSTAPLRAQSNTNSSTSSATAPSAKWHEQINGVGFWSGCFCDRGNMLKCDDFGGDLTGNWSAQACFEHCRDLGFGDPHDLDRDNDNVVCE